MAPKLKLFDFTMIVVSCVIGMGIFRTPLNVAQVAPNSIAFFAVWLAGGLMAFCGALTYAEIGSRMPVTGGYYKIFAYAYHPSLAFAINCAILVSNAASLSGVALVGGEYLTGIFIPLSKEKAWMDIAANAAYIKNLQIVIALVAIVLFYGVNLLGLRMSAKTQNVLTMIKIVLILLLVAPLFFVDESTAVQTATTIDPTLKEYIKAFGVGLVAVSFTYGGYQQTINFGEEVEDVKRNVPRGIFMGIAIIISLYLIINYAYVKVIGFDTLRDPNTKNIAAIMAGKVFGINAERVLSGFLFLSVLAYVNILLMSNPRVMYAMSKDGILPKVFGKVTEKKGVLLTSLSVFAAICVVIVFWAEEFDKLLTFSMFLDCFGMVLSSGSIFILRKRNNTLVNGYVMKWYPLLPIIFILSYIFIAVSIALDYKANDNAALVGSFVLVFFTALYFGLEYLKKLAKK